MNAKLVFRLLLSSVVSQTAMTAGSPARAAERIAPIAATDLDHLLAEIKPERGESPWRDIPWVTSITEARRRSAAEDKPLVIFTAADGSPLGRT
jgi:hypothetical protein